MTISKLFGSTAGTLTLIAGILCTTGCKDQPIHPNQVNVLDGATYDSLTLAHGVLTSLRAPVGQDFSHYKGEFNDTVKAYNDALAVYTVYRTSQSERAGCLQPQQLDGEHRASGNRSAI